MDIPYTASLVWVCLACGHLTPYQASPNDWIESANAMGLSPIPDLSVSSPSYLPSMLAAASNEAAFCSPDEVYCRAYPQHHYAGGGRVRAVEPIDGMDSSSSSSSSGNNVCTNNAPPLSARNHSRGHRSPSLGNADRCVNHKPGSYRSMRSASHQRKEQGQLQPQSEVESNGQDSMENVAGMQDGVLRRQHSSSSPRQRSAQRASICGCGCGCLHCTSTAVPLSTTAVPMHSLAALLMEEHIVGSREIRFCENCCEVRFTEARAVSEVMPHSDAGVGQSAVAAAGTMEDARGSIQTARHNDWAFEQHSQSMCPGSAYPEVLSYERGADGGNSHAYVSSAPSPDLPHGDYAHGSLGIDPAASAFFSSYATPSHVHADPYGTVRERRQADVPPSPRASQRRSPRPDHPSPQPRPASPAARSFAPAASGEFQSKREIPSVHLVVALSIARMVLNLKDAVAAIIGSLYPLSLPRPAPRSSRRDPEEGREINSVGNDKAGQAHCCHEKHRLHNSHRRALPRPQQPLSPAPTAGATPSSYEPLAKPYPRQPLYPWNSSFDETGAVGDIDSDGISRNSFNAPSPPLPQQKRCSWLSQASNSQAEVHASGGSDLSSNSSSDCNPACAQLLYPDATSTEVNSVKSRASTAMAPTTPSTALLRVCKEKWHSMSIAESLWRLVLPFFGPPFFANVHAIPHHSADRRHKPYRGFRGEVEEAVSRLDPMQLEVAKLRLEQILTEVTAAQARLERGQ
ncbi:hypothetical protein ABL78_1725 [Leptomonas seymouri]|uniref:Uncharacterized protein n=1 Tax=Leptomonas seymouri TaxID=5684 RepID=A0A0N1PEQ0_LEPSE|nr:hypothetical protein ABL78_1725 [Leptomonas seymouri]|eukprot:KPI89162.1 hypothetical protein ABL78_1725 [Leptomonas seymouri]